MHQRPRTIRSTLCLLAALPAGCAERSQRDGGPLLVVREQEAAWNRGDLLAFMAGYHRSEEASFSSADGTIRGWDVVLERYRKRYPDRAAMGRLSFSGLRARLLGRDAALVTGQWRLERAGDAPGGVFSLVLVRFPEGWRIVHDHTSAFPR
ncbi:MAG: nuclear transport factor 2 family protein [Planctomycetes bacterium]|nr:nuclear transport factor 2 family protein [Planctomycetota bacterium]